MSSHRKPPLYPYRHGHCQWCDEPIPTRLKKNGEPYKFQPSWHPQCGKWVWAIQNVERMREALIERDGERCAKCGEVPMSWEPRHPPRIVAYPARHCRIERKIVLHVDHVVPLWKVADLPIAKRQAYFLPENMQLLCRACHHLKSAKEAAERAHFKRLANGGKKKSGQPIKSRGFDKRYRKRMNGTVEARR